MKDNRFGLFIKMLIKFGLGFAVIGLVLFASAGSISYRNGWVFILSLAIPMAAFGLALLIKDPSALARRLSSKEPDKKQSAVIAFSGVMFLALFVISGLDYRFGWSNMRLPITIAAVAVMLAGYALFVVVILQNSYAARVVDVYEDQKIITTGLYALVRHPMYLATLLIFLSMPLILGSWYAAIPVLAYPIILVRRIKNEEAMLLKELDGYHEYVKNIRFRLLPFIW